MMSVETFSRSSDVRPKALLERTHLHWLLIPPDSKPEESPAQEFVLELSAHEMKEKARKKLTK